MNLIESLSLLPSQLCIISAVFGKAARFSSLQEKKNKYVWATELYTGRILIANISEVKTQREMTCQIWCRKLSKVEFSLLTMF